MNMPSKIRTERGKAVDQEAIIRLRPQIEEWVRDNHGDFHHTELVWWMNDDTSFSFELHFMSEPNEKSEG
jgi:hypothetical protein